jgi:hypothetical protein
MKSIYWIGVFCLSLLVSASGLACEQSSCGKAAAKKEKAPAKQKQTATVTEKTALTGTYIKRDVRRSGQITDGPNAVMVLDSETIRRSGASDVRELLVRRGAHR